jgi:hypothetical protein
VVEATDSDTHALLHMTIGPGPFGPGAGDAASRSRSTVWRSALGGRPHPLASTI